MLRMLHKYISIPFHPPRSNARQYVFHSRGGCLEIYLGVGGWGCGGWGIVPRFSFVDYFFTPGSIKGESISLAYSKKRVLKRPPDLPQMGEIVGLKITYPTSPMYQYHLATNPPKHLSCKVV